jgi:hypothetical protein
MLDLCCTARECCSNSGYPVKVTDKVIPYPPSENCFYYCSGWQAMYIHTTATSELLYWDHLSLSSNLNLYFLFHVEESFAVELPVEVKLYLLFYVLCYLFFILWTIFVKPFKPKSNKVQRHQSFKV